MSLDNPLLSRLILLLKVLGHETAVIVGWNAWRRNYQKAAAILDPWLLMGLFDDGSLFQPEFNPWTDTSSIEIEM